MIPDFFILIVGAIFLALAAFQFYILIKLRGLDKEVSELAALVLRLTGESKKTEEASGAVH